VTVRCEALGVSTQGFYAWRSQPESEQQRRGDALRVEIRAAHAEAKGRHGSPRIAAELQAKGDPTDARKGWVANHPSALPFTSGG
jgi:putative transposase